MNCIILIFLFLTACATGPKCGNLKNANSVYDDKKSCEIRIRQVVVGSKMQIPESLKGPEIANYEMIWIESEMIDGKIQLGHFVLIPKTGSVSNDK